MLEPSNNNRIGYGCVLPTKARNYFPAQMARYHVNIKAELAWLVRIDQSAMPALSLKPYADRHFAWWLNLNLKLRFTLTVSWFDYHTLFSLDLTSTVGEDWLIKRSGIRPSGDNTQARAMTVTHALWNIFLHLYQERHTSTCLADCFQMFSQ